MMMKYAHLIVELARSEQIRATSTERLHGKYEDTIIQRHADASLAEILNMNGSLLEAERMMFTAVG